MTSNLSASLSSTNILRQRDFYLKNLKNPFEISRHHEREKLSLLESVNINPEPVQRHETTRGGKRTYFDDV